jgi:hypothetical protein
MWIGQGKPTMAARFRFVQKTQNIMVQFFGGFERTIYTQRIGRFGYLQNF